MEITDWTNRLICYKNNIRSINVEGQFLSLIDKLLYFYRWENMWEYLSCDVLKLSVLNLRHNVQYNLRMMYTSWSPAYLNYHAWANTDTNKASKPNKDLSTSINVKAVIVY